jgi:uncharacterized membrane protein YedE/YeeE
MIYYSIILICGILFGCGLTISNMINPNKILNFLDITGNWDPSLLFVMLGAVMISWVGYQFILRLKRPILANKFYLPEKISLDAKLIIGAAIFGIGWGLAGYCPGPAITALGLGIMDAFYFVTGMIVSLLLFAFVTYLKKD